MPDAFSAAFAARLRHAFDAMPFTLLIFTLMLMLCWRICYAIDMPLLLRRHAISDATTLIFRYAARYAAADTPPLLFR